MNVSLIEMVFAIALSGVILASAIIPTTQVMIAYQDAELDGQIMLMQSAAAVRAQQVANAVWRDPNAPDGHATLQSATAGQLQVGDWQLRAANGRLEQQRQATGWKTIAEPVQSFAFAYLLTSGVWTAAPAAGELGSVIVVRCGWNDSRSGLSYGATAVVPDRCFSAGVLSLERPSTGTAYRRADYERHSTLTLGTWP